MWRKAILGHVYIFAGIFLWWELAKLHWHELEDGTVLWQWGLALPLPLPHLAQRTFGTDGIQGSEMNMDLHKAFYFLCFISSFSSE